MDEEDVDLVDISVYHSTYKHPYECISSLDMAMRWPDQLAGIDRRVAVYLSDLKRLASAAGVEPWQPRKAVSGSDG
jgi:hypothetical protein